MMPPDMAGSKSGRVYPKIKGNLPQGSRRDTEKINNGCFPIYSPSRILSLPLAASVVKVFVVPADIPVFSPLREWLSRRLRDSAAVYPRKPAGKRAGN